MKRTEGERQEPQAPSKPLTMTEKQERVLRGVARQSLMLGTDHTKAVLAEVDALRAALAAAEAREQEAFAAGVQQGLFTRDEAAAKVLAAEKASRIGWAESAERWRNHYYETLALLADERRQMTAALEAERLHADALAAGYKAGDGGRCGVCGVREEEHHEYCPAAAHAARRAHDSECESEFDSQVHAHTPCGCAARARSEGGKA